MEVISLHCPVMAVIASFRLGFDRLQRAKMVGDSFVPRLHPPGEEKGLVTIRHPARPSDVARLACGMTNHSTVRVRGPPSKEQTRGFNV